MSIIKGGARPAPTPAPHVCTPEPGIFIEQRTGDTYRVSSPYMLSDHHTRYAIGTLVVCDECGKPWKCSRARMMVPAWRKRVRP